MPKLSVNLYLLVGAVVLWFIWSAWKTRSTATVQFPAGDIPMTGPGSSPAIQQRIAAYANRSPKGASR